MMTNIQLFAIIVVAHGLGMALGILWGYRIREDEEKK